MGRIQARWNEALPIGTVVFVSGGYRGTVDRIETSPNRENVLVNVNVVCLTHKLKRKRLISGDLVYKYVELVKPKVFGCNYSNIYYEVPQN